MKLAYKVPLLVTIILVALINSAEAAAPICRRSNFSHSEYSVERTMECHFSNTESTIFSLESLLEALPPNALHSCKQINWLDITSEGEIILPSQAFVNFTVKSLKCGYYNVLSIKAKKGIAMAKDTFSGIRIEELHLLGNLEAAKPDEQIVHFDGLNNRYLIIEGLKNFDFSNAVQMDEFRYKGSSVNQTIVWPKLDLIHSLDLTIDEFGSQFGNLPTLQWLSVHSLSLSKGSTPVKLLMQTLESMDLSKLFRLDLRFCHTPAVVNLSFKQLPKLAYLILDYNNIKELPGSWDDVFGDLNPDFIGLNNQ